MFDCWVALLLVTPDFSMIVINSDKYLEKIEKTLMLQNLLDFDQIWVAQI